MKNTYERITELELLRLGFVSTGLNGNMFYKKLPDGNYCVVESDGIDFDILLNDKNNGLVFLINTECLFIIKNVLYWLTIYF